MQSKLKQLKGIALFALKQSIPSAPSTLVDTAMSVCLALKGGVTNALSFLLELLSFTPLSFEGMFENFKNSIFLL